ncbi:unnamed protein product, partial [Rotaria sp. Silwood2]
LLSAMTNFHYFKPFIGNDESNYRATLDYESLLNMTTST